MSIVLDGTSGLTSPAAVLTTTPLAVTSGGTGVTTSTGTGAVVLGTSPTITGATITVAATAAPAFSAYVSTNQVITTSTFTKVTFQTKDYDTATAYDNTTNYRFTPQVAGYYKVSSALTIATASTRTIIFVYKNGSVTKAIVDIPGSMNTIGGTSPDVFLNGSTDYIEIYVYIVGTTPTVSNGSPYTYFQASMIRSA